MPIRSIEIHWYNVFGSRNASRLTRRYKRNGRLPKGFATSTSTTKNLTGYITYFIKSSENGKIWFLAWRAQANKRTYFTE